MNDQLASLFKAFRENETSELEVVMSQKSQSGIPYEAFMNIYNLLQKWTTKDLIVYNGYAEVKDFFYHGSVRQRCRQGFDDENIVKTKIHSIRAKCPERKFIELNFTLKDEVPVVDSFILTMNKEPIETRIQLIWEFEQKETFKYILKKVQSGKSEAEACQNDPQYEVEIEINRNSPHLKQFSDQEMATKFIAKTLDLVGRRHPKTNLIENLSLELFSTSEKRKKEKKTAETQTPTRKYVSKKPKQSN